MSKVVGSNGHHSFYERHERQLGKVIAVLGVALAAISLGFVISGFGSSTDCGVNIGRESQLDFSTTVQIKNLQCEGGIATLGIVTGVGGLLIASLGLWMINNAKKRERNVAELSRFERESIKTSAQRWKTVALVLGFVVAMTGVGMILSSSLFLKHQVPAIQDFINKNPQLDGYHFTEHWLDPKIPKLRGLIAGGFFTALIGGGLMVVGYGTAAIREKFKLWREDKKAAALAETTEL